ncbi:cupin domain-containing protein [Streptomyces celluloflavus]|uniref:Cupin domain-containing protein n=1 Tax=Streptomyces celluloflavus TaxID=58344 RepID=A0ABW7RC33_9ACTN|nr:cupin domain-containing protein [Streptomyces celluloflavus]
MFGISIDTTHTPGARGHALRLDPEGSPFRTLAAVRIQVPAGGTIPAHAHGASELLLTGLAGVVTASCGCGSKTVAPGTLAMLPAGKELTLTNTGHEDATLLAVFSQSEFTENLPRAGAQGCGCQGRHHA